MPKFKCHCGTIINLSKIPCRHEFSLVPDAVVTELLMQINAKQCDVDTVEDLIDTNLKNVIECNTCGRLHVSKSPGTNEYESFVRETYASPKPQGGS